MELAPCFLELFVGPVRANAARDVAPLDLVEFV
jgi:hypothetical protein